MKMIIMVFCFLPILFFGTNDSIQDKRLKNDLSNDSIFDTTFTAKFRTENIQESNTKNLFEKKLLKLDENTPMNLDYNEHVQRYIDSYLTTNKMLISKMLSIAPYYFSDIEQRLDKYSLPLELKYLAIVESALNPQARSISGACGLWQFMYSTGKQYGLSVTSYMDERQDPIKSTEAACKYFLKLYDMFGDWNLVLAAYNGGPGYIQRKILKTNCTDFWSLREHLREETRNYIPTFIAVNYAMAYHSEYNIFGDFANVFNREVDTLYLKAQTEFKTIEEITCVSKDTIRYLNPAYKKDIFPENSLLTLPKESVEDFLLNEEANYFFIEAVENKEILIDEERIVYKVKNGDYLGRIAKQYNLFVYQIKSWNNLKTSQIDVNDKLILYVKKPAKNENKEEKIRGKEYIIQQGDTLWEIAQKHNGLTIWKIKEYNNLDSDLLTPGTKIILPDT